MTATNRKLRKGQKVLADGRVLTVKSRELHEHREFYRVEEIEGALFLSQSLQRIDAAESLPAAPEQIVCQHCRLPIRKTGMDRVRNEWEHLDGMSYCKGASTYAWPVAAVEAQEKPTCPVCHKPSGDYENPEGCWHNVTAEGKIEYVAEPKPTPSTSETRLQRQRTIGNWCVAAFGEQEATSLPQRGIRLFEEAGETAQVTGVTAEMAHAMVNYVWSRPVGKLFQELGGVGVTTLALAQAALLDADECEAIEVERVLGKPIEHFTKRNQAKNDAGFLTKPQPDSSSIPELDRLAHTLAYESSCAAIEGECIGADEDWQSLEQANMDALKDDIRYLEMRGLLEHHPQFPHWIRFHDESEATA